MFQGVTTVSLDSKGRLVVPARYRELLAATGNGLITITADPMRCLMLYPNSVWKPIEARIAALSDLNLRTRGLKQVMLGYSQDNEFDSAGRVMLTPMQRKFAGLDKSIVLVGQANRLELWDEANWEASIAQAVESAKEAPPPELDGFTL